MTTEPQLRLDPAPPPEELAKRLRVIVASMRTAQQRGLTRHVSDGDVVDLRRRSRRAGNNRRRTSMSDTDGLAAETRQLLDAATELTAEWYIERTYNKRVPDHWSVDVLSDDDHVCSVRGGDEGAHALAALIAAAPRLLANWLAREDRLADATVLDVLADWWFAADYCNQPEPFKVRVSESIVDALQEGGYEVVPIAERDRLADENRALREAIETHEDLHRPVGPDSPNGPIHMDGWPCCDDDRHLWAAADRGVTDGDRNEGDEE